MGGGSETSGLAMQIVWGVGAETFAFDVALEGGVQRQIVLATQRMYIYLYEEMRGV